jgi:hypothetical protein
MLLAAAGGACVSADVESARRDWEDGSRRYELACRDPNREPRLRNQFEIISGELRRRVGGHFTLATLTSVYQGSESWMLHAVEEEAPSPGWARTVSMVGDAAFHTYARGAVDYEP